MATIRFQRGQPGSLEVRGVSRQKLSSPDNMFEEFENSRLSSLLNSNSDSRRQNEQSYLEFINSSLDYPQIISTPPVGSPTSSEELDAKGPADWTTGAMTERSSVSWMDEFDKQTTKTVERMFREIDYALYESRESSSSNLLSTSDALGQECEDWSSKFPHMRIVGQTAISPVTHIRSKERSSNTSTPVLLLVNEQIDGYWPRENVEYSQKDNSETEVIYAIDGEGVSKSQVNSSSDLKIQVSLPSTLHSNRSRMAPSMATGTPILRTREELVHQLTWEAMWPVVARCIRPLLLAMKADLGHSIYTTPVPDDIKQSSTGNGGNGQTSSVPTSRLAQSRPTGNFFSQSGVRNTSSNTGLAGSADTQRMLGSLLLISSKQINYRKPDSLETVPPLQFQPVQPLQQQSIQQVSIPQSQQPISRASTSQQQRPTSGARVPSASRGRLGRGRLHPMDRPKTPSQMQQDDYIFDGLRGQKLHTAAELRPQQSSFSGPLGMPKNNPLPPLHHSYGGVTSNALVQPAGEFLSVAPVVGSSAVMRGPQRYVPTTNRSPSAAVVPERPTPTFRIANDMYSGQAPATAVSTSRNNASNSLYILNRSNTLLNITGVGVIGGGGIGQIEDFERTTAPSRTPATAIGMARASLVTSSFNTAQHNFGR